MRLERQRASRAVNRISAEFGPRTKSFSPYVWEQDDRLSDYSDVYQENIPRAGGDSTEVAVFILGERVGLPLPPDASIPTQVAEYLEPLSELFDWPGQAGYPSPHKVPLTGTLYELIDALASDHVKCLIYIKAPPPSDVAPQLVASARRFGFGSYLRDYTERCGGFLNAEQQAYYGSQIECMARVQNWLVGRATRYFETPEQFQFQLEADLGKHLRGTRPADVEAAFKGLEHFDISDAALFFGRDEEIRDVFNFFESCGESSSHTLQTSILLSGRSGVGKTSFLNAGLSATALNPNSRLRSLADELSVEPLVVSVQDIEASFDGHSKRHATRLPAFLKLLKQGFDMDLSETMDLDQIKQRMENYPSKILLLLDEVEQAFQSEDVATAARWQQIFDLLDYLTKAHAIWLVVSISDTNRIDDVSSGFVHKWQELGFLEGSRPMEIFPLEPTPIISAHQACFLACGMVLRDDTKDILKKKVQYLFQSNQDRDGSTQTLVAVAMQMTAEASQKRISKEMSSLVPARRDGRSRRMWREQFLQDRPPVQIAPDMMVEPEKAIAHLADQAFFGFLRTDLGYDSVSDRPQAEAEGLRMLSSLLSWLVVDNGAAASGRLSAKQEFSARRLACRTANQRRVEKALGADGPALVQRFVNVRLLRRDKQRNIGLSHRLLLEHWPIAEKAASMEIERLAAYRRLRNHRERDGVTPTDEERESWAFLYRAWGAAGPWDTAARGKDRLTDLDWLRLELFGSISSESDPATLKKILQSALEAGDDLVAFQAVQQAQNVKGDAITILSSRVPKTTNPMNPPFIMQAAERGMDNTVELLINTLSQPFSRNLRGQSILHLLAFSQKARLLQVASDKLETMHWKRIRFVRSSELGSAPLVSRGGWTPLHYAARGGSVAVVNSVLRIYSALGIKHVSKINNYANALPGANPFHLAAHAPRWQATRMIRALAKLDDKRMSPDQRGYLPAHHAIMNDNAPALAELCKGVLKAKLGARYPLENSQTKGEPNKDDTLTIFAARRDASHCMQVLKSFGLLDSKKVFPEAFRIAAGYGADRVLEVMQERLSKTGIAQLMQGNALDSQNRNPLHLAAQYRRAAFVDYFCGRPDVSEILPSRMLGGLTALHLAAKFWHADSAEATRGIVRRLLEAGADFEAKDDNDFTPLDWALASRNVEALLAILDHVHGGRFQLTPWRLRQAASLPNETARHRVFDLATDEQFYIALGEEVSLVHELARMNDTELLGRAIQVGRGIPDLVEKSDSTEDGGGYDRTPLIAAAEADADDSIRLLTRLGARRTAVQQGRRNALHLCIIKDSILAMNALLEGATADELRMLVTQADEVGKTPLHVAAEMSSPDVIARLLDIGSDPASPQENTPQVKKLESGRTPAHIAAYNGYADTLRQMVLAHPEVAAIRSPQSGDSLLHSAAAGGRSACVDVLFETEPTAAYEALRSCNSAGRTPLHSAIRAIPKASKNGKAAEAEAKATFEALLKRQLNTPLEDYPVLDQQANSNRICSDPSALSGAVAENDLDTLKRLIELGMTEVSVAPPKASPLHTAAHFNRLEAFDLLSKFAEEKDYEKLDRYNRSVLETACASGSVEIVRRLVKDDTDILLYSKRNRPSPLCYAILSGRKSIIELVDKRRLRQFALDEPAFAATCIRFAIFGEQSQIMRNLVELGFPADVELKTAQNDLKEIGDQEVGIVDQAKISEDLDLVEETPTGLGSNSHAGTTEKPSTSDSATPRKFHDWPLYLAWMVSTIMAILLVIAIT